MLNSTLTNGANEKKALQAIMIYGLHAGIMERTTCGLHVITIEKPLVFDLHFTETLM